MYFKCQALLRIILISIGCYISFGLLLFRLLYEILHTKNNNLWFHKLFNTLPSKTNQSDVEWLQRVAPSWCVLRRPVVELEQSRLLVAKLLICFTESTKVVYVQHERSRVGMYFSHLDESSCQLGLIGRKECPKHTKMYNCMYTDNYK